MARSNTPATDVPGTASADAKPSAELKFETALVELEQIVQDMEGGRLPLEESLEAYRRGLELLKHCQQQLGDAERKIQILEDGALRDFEPGAGEAGEAKP
jgi:exodeoxyribonuclease VII small subunit